MGDKKAGRPRVALERLPEGWRSRLERFVKEKWEHDGAAVKDVPRMLGVSPNTLRDGEHNGGLTWSMLRKISAKLGLADVSELLEILKPDTSVAVSIAHDPRPKRNRPELTVPKLFACSIQATSKTKQPAYRVDLKPTSLRLCDPNKPDVERVVGVLSLGEIWARIESESDQVRIQHPASALEQRIYADGSVCADMGSQGAPHFRLVNWANGLDGKYSIGGSEDATFQILQEGERTDATVTLEVTSRGGFHFSKPTDHFERTPGGERSDAERKAFARAVEAWVKTNAALKSDDFAPEHRPKDLLPDASTTFRLATVYFKTNGTSDDEESR